MWRFLLVFALVVLMTSCGPSPFSVLTDTANTEAVRDATGTIMAATATTGAPSSTPVPSDTPVPTATATTPLPSATPTRTPRPTHTPPPTVTDTLTPAPTNTATRPPAPLASPTASPPPTPDFLGIVFRVRAEIENFRHQVNLGLKFGRVDCQPLVSSYEYVAARATLTLPASLAGPNALYTEGVNLFISKGNAQYVACKAFLAGTSSSPSVNTPEWTMTLGSVNAALIRLNQSITAAGGTP